MILSGTLLAEKKRQELAVKIKQEKAQPHLHIFLVGEDPASQVYVRNKQKACTEVGILCSLDTLPSTISQKELLDRIQFANKDKNTHGILVQFPLPEHIDKQAIVEAVLPQKDVDGFHPVNLNRPDAADTNLFSCTALGVKELLLSAIGTDYLTKHIVVVGYGQTAGYPIVQLLLAEGCKLTVCTHETADITEHTRQADILISAVGKGNLITADMVKPGVIVLDIGMSRGEDGKLRGDVDFEHVAPIASYITPVPGGVGPMTVAMLCWNVYKAYKNQKG